MLRLIILLSVFHLNLTHHNYTHFWNHDQVSYYKLGSTAVFKDTVQGCTVKENNLLPLTCIVGYECSRFPTQFRTNRNMLKIKMTTIKKIDKHDLTHLGNLTVLSIEYNLELDNLEVGCFRNMSQLVYLKITLNPKLIYLEENIFEGLYNLEHLILRKNGFEHIPDLSITMKVSTLPNLKYLDLSENSLKKINKNDFASMNGSQLEVLKFALCDLHYIHPESLGVFKQLVDLDVGQNHCMATMITNLISTLVETGIQLEVISLYDLGYREKPPMDILQAISKSNITNLSLAKNQLEQLGRNDFPPSMPKIKSLDLSDNLIVSFENDTFQGFPNLEELLLAGNKFTKIFPAFLLPQLKILDLRLLTGKISAVSYLSIPNNMFNKMNRLKDLALSYNLIETVTKFTFKGLDNLKYLELKNATIYSIEKGSFKNLKELNILNLENNVLKTLTPTQEVFTGLEKLESLLFGGSGISNLSVYPSPFTPLPNLIYLGLNNNALSTLSPHVFSPLKKLQVLDLSYNKLIPWTDRLITNHGLKYLDVKQNKFTFFTTAMLKDFSEVDYVDLEGNPIVCDCNLFPVDTNIDSLHKYKNISNMYDVKCSDFETKQQKNIKEFIEFLKTHPGYCEVTNSTSKTITVTLLTIFFLLMIVSFGLGYVYRHYIRYWLFLLKITIQKHSKWWKSDYSMQDLGFKYDAFVSYSCEDFLFVNKLVFQLEENDPKLKLCLYERDFRIGSIISEEVLQGVLRSKRTLLVISDSFAKSHWCRWETKLAEYHQIFFREDGNRRLDDTLVMIKLNDVTKKYVTPTLRYLMKTRIYLEYNDKKEEEFWKKLKNTLITPKNHKNFP